MTAAGGISARYPTAILASGSGSNLQAVLDQANAGTLPLDIRLVVSNRVDAYALERARSAGIATLVMTFSAGVESRARYSRELAAAVKASGAQLVLMLGWMLVLTPEFLDAGFAGVLNLHPSFLPDDPSTDQVTLPDGSSSRVFRGAHALRDAIEAGVRTTGATLIEITPEVDRGPVLARRTFELRPGDTVESALERLHLVEQEVVRDGVMAWLAKNVVPERSSGDSSERSSDAMR
ncbi:MAG TPA: formyltransferase family protein [Candidatus Eremiobacteraceae bacterium]|nr:formyltransferase family protein [Candidatus Eremiobacteraceae bacterium]